jgi:Ca2+-transporting ATPase
MLNSGGLSSVTAMRRLEEEGYNELPTSRPRRLHQIAAEVLREPMVFLLVACGVIYLFLGDRQEAWMLLGFLFIILGITLYQETKTERALEALKELSSPRALVLRDGRRQRVPGREVVREDLVFVNEGDKVPADGVLISGVNIAVDESLLTGESSPVEKTDIGSSLLYAGTVLIRGQGVLGVTSTGASTELGKIGKSLSTYRREPTRLEVQTRGLVTKLAWIAAFLCVIVAVVYAFKRGDWLAGLLAGLTLAMAILPNELPAVLTVFLALGAWRISQRRVLTRRMSAIEDLGSATVLCVDKTGTLTLNRMTIRKLCVQEGVLDLEEVSASTLPEEFHEVLEYGILASKQDPIDPMERAFLSAGDDYLRGTEHLHQNWTLFREYPLSSELLSISRAWKPGERPVGDEYVVGAKGAPEAIVDLCHLEPDQAKRISSQAESLAREGLRVLGVAKASLKSRQLPPGQHDFDFKYLGLIGLADPIRPEVPRAMEECRSAGIRVIMITGDHPDTARSIARQIGLGNWESVITGSELDRMSEEQLAQAVRNTHVFSRMAPAQKLRLVEALKSSGEIVAMTGDGVNDAPALKSANIGIAMGGRGTDVAREAASLVLLDDDFASIVEAIRMGRRIYRNLRRAIVYLLAVHIPIAGMSVLPVILDLPLLLLPVHVAFLHLIIEPVCSVAFEAEPASPHAMEESPRNPREPIFSARLFGPSLLQGTSVLASLLMVYVVSLYRGQGEQDARALAFTSLIISNLVLILTSGDAIRVRSGNRVILGIIFAAMAMLGLILYSPALRGLFRFSELHPLDLLLCVLVGVLSVVWIEGLKLLGRKLSSSNG